MATSVRLRVVHATQQSDDPTAARHVHLGYREVRTLRRPAPGQQVVSDRCTLWVSEEGALDDVILEPGERFTVTRSRRLVLQGMR